MRYLLRFSFFIFAIAMSSQAFGQNLLSKANKQYELKAYIYAIPNYLAILQKDSDEVQAYRIWQTAIGCLIKWMKQKNGIPKQ